MRVLKVKKQDLKIRNALKWVIFVNFFFLNRGINWYKDKLLLVISKRGKESVSGSFVAKNWIESSRSRLLKNKSL